MSHLTIKAFFFNAKTDYLPYYKNFSLSFDEGATAKDLLIAIQAKNENFSFPETNLVFKINQLVVTSETTIANIVKKLGTQLQVDPVSSYRSNNGLIINDDDFMKSFELLAPYASDEDKTYYESLYALHYASETSLFNRQYIGDAILILAHKMITEGNENKEAILTAISSDFSGLFDCEYENNLFDAQDHTKTIMSLKAMAKPIVTTSPLALFMSLFSKSKKEESLKNNDIKPQREAKPIKNIENKTVAFHGNTADASQRIVTITRAHKLSGLTILKDNKTLAFHKAGAILLEAFDAGAELLVVEDIPTLDMFNKYFKSIEKTVGRKIIGLELMSKDDFVAQMNNI